MLLVSSTPPSQLSELFTHTQVNLTELKSNKVHICMCQWSTLVPALIQPSLYSTVVTQSRREKHVSDHNFAITDFKFECVAALPYDWSSWTVYVQQWDWLRLCGEGETNYDTAWFYDLSLQHPPTLWARRQQRFSSTFCTAPPQRTAWSCMAPVLS